MRTAVALLPLVVAACGAPAPTGGPDVGRAVLAERATENLIAAFAGSRQFSMTPQTAPCVVATATDAEVAQLARRTSGLATVLGPILSRAPARSCLQGGAL